MSTTTPTALSSFSSKLHATFEASLEEYEKKTETSLLTHPLMARLQACNSRADIHAVLRSQATNFERATSADDKLIKWLGPIVNVLSASSSVISACVGLVFSPANFVFAGAGVLLSAAKDITPSHDALIIIFGKIENFFIRLKEYAKVPMTEAMKDIMVNIMVEVLEIFAIMTKEIKQGQSKRHLKKLAERKGIKDAMSRLDRLTEEAVKTATVILEVAHLIKGGVRAVSGNVNQLIEDGEEMKGHMDEEKRRRILEERRSRVRADRRWLSPPDPSINQNVASHAQHQGTAMWFFEEDIFVEWKSKSTAPLLWIHGKPGSGKSVLCSAIVQDIIALRDAGLASLAYFYFDFKDFDKQSLHSALASILTQLSAHSDRCCEILSYHYVAHDDGAHKPSTSTMIACLKEMLALPDQGSVYIILDALDECPDTSGIPSAREKVLDFLKDLVGVQFSDIHICVTSRPEIGIRAALEPLAFRSLSIHDQKGQEKDIEDYIRSVIYSDSRTRRWRYDDKEMVINKLNEKADGMFRWVFCQLEVLCHTSPFYLRQTLEELPKSLDETFMRILKEIRMADRDLARRLLQCLSVATRPLRVEELAEIRELDFDGAEGATLELIEGRRWENPQQGVLSICSSLIMVVDTGHSRIVQFSHFSVKKFLTSDRLAASQSDISCFHIALRPAHTTLTQVCLATLLRLDGSSSNDQVERNFPLARYAGQYWVEHAQFEGASSWIGDGLRRLFDSAKPYFATWLRLYDIDDHWNQSGNSWVARGSPLYYASLCGFRDLAEHILNVHPEQVNATGGRLHSPLAAALHKGHFHVAELLLQYGATVDVTDHNNQTPLQAASVDGSSDVVRWLLEHGADPNSQRDDLGAPIHLAAANGHLEVIRTLLNHGVYVDSADKDGRTPLHLASTSGKVEIARLLLERGANANALDNDGWTPLSLTWTTEVERLLDGGASLDEEGRST